MDIYAISVLMKTEGAAAVRAALESLRGKFQETENSAKGMDRALLAVGGQLKALVAGVGAAAIVAKVSQETSEAGFAQAQLAAALKSTRNIAGQTSAALNEHAEALSRVSVFDDDVISGAQALLLTFTQIRGPIFQEATEAILNVAQAMGTDLRSATIQVGKALNDPILGVTALARAGIQFTDSQKDMIKELVEGNRLLDAQKIILAELETQFGGSAEAARNTFGGALQGLMNDLGNALTLTGDTANIATRAINGLAGVVRDARREIETQYASLKSFYTSFVGFFRILKAMELGPGYAAEYDKITGEMRAARAEFDRLASGADQLRPPTQKAADFMQKFSGSTLAGASAFGLMSDRVFGAKVVVSDFNGVLNKTQQGTVSYIKQLIELAGLIPITTVQQTQLTAEQTRLRGALGSVNLSMTRRLELAKELAAVERALANATVSRTVAEAEAAMRTPPTVGRTPSGGPGKIDPSSIRATAQQIGALIDMEFTNNVISVAEQLQQTFATGFGNALGQGIASGFETALSQKSIGQGFKALTGTILASFGSMLVQFGTKALIASKQIQNLFSTLFTPGPMSAFAAAAIIAIGAGLMAAGRGITASVGPTGGGFAAGSSMPSGPMTLPGISFGPTMSRSAADLTPANNLTFNIIGTNDPSAQRQLQEMLRNADRRGNTTTV